MAENKTVLYRQEGRIGYITLNRPEKLNALNIHMLNEIEDILDSLDMDVVRCLIITGAGDKAFAAGSDIAEILAMNSREAMDYSEKGHTVFHRLELLPIPVIAAVNGYALGGGWGLALACDMCFCSENAVFGQPEVKLGITPGFGSTQRLARLVGLYMAKQLIYSGEPIDAKEAFRIRAVNAVYPQKELMPAAERLAKSICSNVSLAVRESKRAIVRSLGVRIEDGKIIEERAFGQCFGTQEQRDAMRGFLQTMKKK